MKNVVNLAKKCFRKSPGFTLAEMMVAMTVGGFVMAGVFAVWTQLFDVTATNSNYMAAFRQVQNGGDWISNDALMTQEVYQMALTNLDGGIGAGDAEITVDDVGEFPPIGIIGIEGELIQYTGVDTTDNKFTGCVRGGDAAAHNDGESVTVFLFLSWTAWSGDQEQVVYNLNEDSRQLLRSHIVNGNLQGTTGVAEAIVPASTSSTWTYSNKELTLVITAQIGEEIATRIYRVNPRPFF